ncbi:MAG TPA: TonB-dependent receptor [Woeseiaceae bacterium]|nr:TonB-dependent receptor [Woeseiaceae bacterium]
MKQKKRPAPAVGWPTSWIVPLLVLAFAANAAMAAEVVDFADMTLEELGNLKVISVSKKPENLADAAGSVFVITAEDIRRAGVTSLAEALRLAPNLHVARLHGSGYSITARGLNGSTTSAPNKLLVLIDGRSVYSPLFSGVFWDVQDVMLEDVERIEVVSGPGGTLWGINAVNGVINVITRSAMDTQGGFVAARAGNFHTGAAFRFGTAGAGGHYRVYGKYSDHDHLSKADGTSVDDGWHKSQIGFRADWKQSSEQLMVQGNAYLGRFGQPEPGAISVSGTDLALGTIEASGVNLTAGWEHLNDNGSQFSLQAYYDRTVRTIPPTLDDTLDILDLQFQHSLAPIGRHALTWGVNYRYGRDRTENTSSIFAFLPERVDQKWSSLFAQDEITLSDDLRLILGARSEHNPYTGNEFLPNARLAWKLAPDHLLWTAVSRAVRGPSRLDADSHVPSTPPFLLEGGPEVRSEVARIAELGYRGQPTPDLSWSVTAFHSDFDHLRTTEIAPSGTFLVFANEMEGTTTGIEMWGAYQALPQWRLSAGYAAMRDRMRLKPGSDDSLGPSSAGKTPANTWQLRSALTIADNRDLDVAVRHVAALSSPDVPAYTAVDMRFAWKLQPNLELSLAAQNLLDADHAEYGPIATRSRIPRTVFLQVRWELQ